MCGTKQFFALLPLPAWEDAGSISSIWAPGDFSHLTNIICSITKQQYFGTQIDQIAKLDSLDGEDWYANWLALWIFYVAPQETDWPIFQAADC